MEVLAEPTGMLASHSASVHRRTKSLIASASSDARYIQNRRDAMAVDLVAPLGGRGMLEISQHVSWLSLGIIGAHFAPETPLRF